MSTNKVISANSDLKGYNRADKIIQYLTTRDESIQLTDTEKDTLNKCRMIHGFRMKYNRKTDIIEVITKEIGVKERQAYNLINETEKIFGSVGKVHKEYERNWLLEVSRKNVERAILKGNSTQITKALLAHYKLAGLEELVPDMPDFSKLEQHKFIINLPVNALEMIMGIIQQGHVKLTEIIPVPKFEDFTDAEEVK